MTVIERALELVADDSRIGLGSGHTAQAFVKALVPLPGATTQTSWSWIDCAPCSCLKT